MSQNQYKLADIADVRAGYAFRKGIDGSDTGPAVIQMKDANSRDGIAWGGVIRTTLPGREPAAWVENNDVLFVARGNNNFAIFIDNVKTETVCTPHFFQIRIKNEAAISAQFLTWQLNQAPCQNYFDNQCEGQGLRNIRRGVLENTPIAIPSFETQNKILSLNQLIDDESRVHEKLLLNHKQLLASIASDIMSRSQ